MANAFKQKQDQEKRNLLLTECVKIFDSGPGGRARAIATYAKGAGVSVVVAEQAIVDRRAATRTDFRKLFQPR